MPHSGYTNKRRPALEAIKSARITSSSTVRLRRRSLTQWYLIMHIYLEKKGGNQVKNIKNEKDDAVSAEDERNYGIDRLLLGKNTNDVIDDSKS